MKFFKEWIRIPGVVAVLVIALLVYFIGQIASGFLLKSAIEEYGSEALGAKVDVASASMSFLPPTIEFTGLAFTDPDNAMMNMFEVAELKANLNLYQLVVGRIVIDDLNYQGLQFNTTRTSSGAIEKKVVLEELQEAESEPNILDAAQAQIPDADTILAKEPLMSKQISEKLQADYESCSTTWTTLKSSLASGDQLTGWGAEIKQLTSAKIVDVADAKNRAARLKELKALLQEQAKNYKEAKNHLADCNKLLKGQLQDLKDAPGKDIDRLNEKYFSGQQAGLSNITQLLFGDEVKTYLDTAMQWYEKAKPIVDALKTPESTEPEVDIYGGEFIEFEEQDRQADFAIKSMLGDAQLEMGHLAVKAKNINVDHAFSGKPTEIVISGDQLKGLDSVLITAKVDRIKPDAPADVYQALIKNYQISDFVLSEDKNLPLTLTLAQLDINSDANYKQDGLSSLTKASFSKASFTVGDQASATVKKVFSSMEQELSNFVIDVNLSRVDGHFKTSVQSDLDNIIGSGIKNALKNEIALEKTKLKIQLQQQATQALQQQMASIDFLDKAQLDVAKDGQGIEDMLKQSLSDPLKQLEDQKKAELEAELEAKKKAEKNKLKDKLKSKFGF